MIVKLLTEHYLEFLCFKGDCTGSSELHLSKCQIVGNLMPWLNLKGEMNNKTCTEIAFHAQVTRSRITSPVLLRIKSH